MEPRSLDEITTPRRFKANRALINLGAFPLRYLPSSLCLIAYVVNMTWYADDMFMVV